jgi:dihydrofolate reductase
MRFETNEASPIHQCNQREREPMRKLIVIEFLSLDGVMQAPGAPEEDTEGGFRHGGWQRPYFDDVLGAAAAEGMAGTDAYLFGRKTYQIMAAFWPTAPDDDPYAGHLNSTPKYVASRTLQNVEWQNSTLIKGDVAEEVAKLKEQPGRDIAVLGSGNLVQALVDNDLVDEYSLTVSPIVLGSGKRLFREADDIRRLRLVDSKPTSTGSLMLTYQPAR